MTTQPFVALDTTDLSEDLLATVAEGRALKTEESIRQALLTHRLLMVNHVRTQLTKVPVSTEEQLLGILEVASRLYLPRFHALLLPTTAATYSKAYIDAKAGNVPMSVIYALAEQHTDQIGAYYNNTSQEAIMQGFTSMVNRKVPARAAAERAIEAFGLTPRQMNGLVTLAPQGAVNSAQPRGLRGRVQQYIAKALESRFKIFAKQEAHNIDLQAQQTAWFWLQQQGALSPLAQKQWLTAEDEKVCPQCGPMHKKKVLLGERFKMPNGNLLYVPGAHVNCRCQVRLLDHALTGVQKNLFGDELEEFNDEHPRGNSGRFSHKARAQAAAQASPETAPAPSGPTRVQRRELSPEMRARYEQLAARMKNAQAKPTFRETDQSIPLAQEPVQELSAESERTAELSPAVERAPELTPAVEQAPELAPAKPKPRYEAVGVGGRFVQYHEIPMARRSAMEQQLHAQQSASPVIGMSSLNLISQLRSPAEPQLATATAHEMQQMSALDQLRAMDIKAADVEFVRPLTESATGSAYAVVDQTDHSGQFQFNGQKFQPNYEAALATAVNRRDARMADVYNRETDYGEVSAQFETRDVRGEELVGRITPTDFEKIIEVVAMSASQENSAYERAKAADDNYIDVYMFEPNSDRVLDEIYADHKETGGPEDFELDMDDEDNNAALEVRRMSPLDIAAEFNITPQMFEVAVLQVDTVHDERGGRGAAQHFSATQSGGGQEYIQIDGSYEAEDSHYDHVNFDQIGVDVYRLKPFDPKRGARPDDWNE